MASQEIFICSTYYHVLIAIMMSLTQRIHADIILMSYIPGYRDLCINLIKSRIFVNVILFERDKKNQHFSKTVFEKVFLHRKRNIRVIQTKLKVDLMRYEKVYIFHDSIELGHYLQDIKRPYILLEDALDFFKIIQETAFANEIPNRRSLKYWLKRLTGIGYLSSGQSKYCVAIYVNDKSGIKIPAQKVVEFPKKTLFGLLTEEDKARITNVFFDVNKLDLNNNEKKVLVLTQPLFEDGIVPTQEIQQRVYQSIRERYANNGYLVYFKPHPRDMFPYQDVFASNAVIDKNAPAEVMEYLGVQFDEAVSINSTAVNSISFAKNKVMLGIDYLNAFVQRAEER